MNSRTTQRGKGRETNLSKDGDQEHASHSPPSVGGVEEGTVVCEKRGEGSELSFLPSLFLSSTRRSSLTPPPLIGPVESDVFFELLPLQRDHSGIRVLPEGGGRRQIAPFEETKYCKKKASSDLVSVESNEEGVGFFVPSVCKKPSRGLSCVRREQEESQSRVEARG